MNEKDILPCVLRQLVAEIDRKVVTILTDEPMPEVDRTSERLRKHLAALENRVSQASERYLSAPADLIPELERQLRKLRDEGDEVERLIQQSEDSQGGSMLEDWLMAREALAVYSVDVPSFEEFYEEFREEARLSGRIVVDPIGLFRLEQALDSRPERLRAYLKDIEFKVKLFWKPMIETATGKPMSGKRTFLGCRLGTSDRFG